MSTRWSPRFIVEFEEEQLPVRYWRNPVLKTVAKANLTRTARTKKNKYIDVVYIYRSAKEKKEIEVKFLCKVPETAAV